MKEITLKDLIGMLPLIPVPLSVEQVRYLISILAEQKSSIDKDTILQIFRQHIVQSGKVVDAVSTALQEKLITTIDVSKS